jgi:DNA repair protein RadC
MPLDIQLMDEEKGWTINSTASIAKIMQSILSRELEISILPPLSNKDKKLNSFKKDPDRYWPVFTTRNSLLDAEIEYCWTIGLRADLKIAFIDLVAIGDAVSVKIGTREALRGFGYYNAVQAILVHNHPSGSLQFSEADLDITRKMIRACWGIYSCELIDHIIINDKFEVASLVEQNGLEKLRDDARFADMDSEEQRKAVAEKEEIVTKQDKLILEQASAIFENLSIINEQSEQINEKDNKIANLDNENKELKNQLAQLATRLNKLDGQKSTL